MLSFNIGPNFTSHDVRHVSLVLCHSFRDSKPIRPEPIEMTNSCTSVHLRLYYLNPNVRANGQKDCNIYNFRHRRHFLITFTSREIHCIHMSDLFKLFTTYSKTSLYAQTLAWYGLLIIGHLHDGVILLLRPESFTFFLSYLNLEFPARIKWQNP